MAMTRRLRYTGAEIESRAVPLHPITRRAIVLGLLIAVGAFAIDMYIPGFAAIARDLHSDAGTVQLTMTAYFLSLAIGQIIYGPLSDAYGRRRPIFAGLGIFAASSIAAAFAPSVGALIAARFLQGIGAAATAVVPMAVISDEHAGPDATRLMSLAMLALSVSPILAPSFGGVLVQYSSWRMIFVVLTIITILAGAMVWRMLPETLPHARRVGTGPLRMCVTYGRLIRDRRFIVPLLIAGCAQSVLLVFISGSPFVVVTLYGVKPVAYGGLFALHAAVLIGTSQFNAYFMRLVGVRRLLGGACGVLVTASTLLTILVAFGMPSLWPLMLLTLTMFTCLGLILAPAFLNAVESFNTTAGAAAALGVALELSISTAATGVLSLTANGTAMPMVVIMACGSCGSLAAWAVFARITQSLTKETESHVF
jgi:DHA1 family bicyclomycin/chloramphenicol resistance-like MFS transporter